MNDKIGRPEPRRWAEPITAEQYEAFVPATLTLVDGYLLGGPEDAEARLNLLALLLKNCGLEEAAMMSSKDDWREATDRAFFDF